MRLHLLFGLGRRGLDGGIRAVRRRGGGVGGRGFGGAGNRSCGGVHTAYGFFSGHFHVFGSSFFAGVFRTAAGGKRERGNRSKSCIGDFLHVSSLCKLVRVPQPGRRPRGGF